MTTKQINIEPCQFGMTGAGICLIYMRDEYRIDAYGASLDAPAYIAVGAIKLGDPGAEFDYLYGSTTVLRREW